MSLKEIDLSTIPNLLTSSSGGSGGTWEGKPCTKRQQERIDYTCTQVLRIKYTRLLEACSKKFGRKVRDVGELTKVEADLVIRWLGARRK